MRIEQLYHFVEVSRHDSISKASKHVYLSQSALSLSIKTLENELGKQLFNRTRNGLALTDYGKVIYRDSLKIIEIVDSWKNIDDENHSETISIVLTPIISHYITPTVIMPFQKENKNVHVNTLPAPHCDILKLATRKDVNMIVCTVPMNRSFTRDLVQNGFQAKQVFTDERQVFMANDNPYAKHDILSEDILRNLTLAYYSNIQDEVSHYFVKYFKENIRLANKQDILDLVARNLGVFIQPYYLFRYDYRVNSKSITSRPFHIEGLSRDAPVFLFFRSSLSLACKRLKDAIEKEFSTLKDAD